METVRQKFYPEVGTKLYLSQRTGDYFVDMVKYPYTVVGTSHGKLLIRSCKLIFNSTRYFDTLADDIQEDPDGEIITLSWAPKKGMWQYDKYQTGYPEYAYFGEWKFQPYLN